MVLAFPVQDSGQADEREERGAELLIAGGDAPMLFDRAEEVLDAVTLAIEATVKVPGAEPLPAHSKAREDVLLVEKRPQCIRVIAFIGHKHCAAHCADTAHQLGSTGDVHDISRAQNKPHCPSSAVHQRMDLGGKPAPAWSHRLRLLTSNRVACANVYPHVTAVDAEELSFCTLAKSFEDARPCAIIPPACKVAINGAPTHCIAGQIAPGTACPQDVKNRSDHGFQLGAWPASAASPFMDFRGLWQLYAGRASAPSQCRFDQP